MKRLYTTIIALFAISCSTSPHGVVKPKDEVVLIFKDAPVQTVTEIIIVPSGNKIDDKICVQYIDSTTDIKYFVPQAIGYDTLAIPTFGSVAEIWHTYKVHETLKYMLQAGDTVLFTYDDKGRPRAQSLTSDSLTQAYNVCYDYPGYIESKSGYSMPSVLNNDYYIAAFRCVQYTKSKSPEWLYRESLKYYINLDSLEACYQKRNASLVRFMDTLTAKGKLSDYQYRFRIDEIDDNNRDIDGRYSARHNSTKKRDVFEKKIQYDDSLIYRLSYRSHVKVTGYTDPITKKPNPEIAFDSIVLNTTITPKTKNIILKGLIDNIIHGIPLMYRSTLDAEKKYRLRYVEFTGDTTYLPTQYLSANYSNDLILEDIAGNMVDYKKLIEDNRGKLIYVDFWASWCSPCRGQFPAYRKLKEKYKDKVLFVYLAVKDIKDKWAQAVKEEGLKDYQYSYFVVNEKDNKFLQEIRLGGIPLFILYDKTGKLCNLNAPRPSSAEISNLFDELLRK